MNYHHMVADDWFRGNIGDTNRYWKERFPNFGMCMTDPENNAAFIPIPRCGSQFFCNWLINKHKWSGNHLLAYQTLLKTYSQWKPEYAKIPKYFSIVREPYERYVSALWILWDQDKKTINDHRLDSKSQMDHLFSDPCMKDHHTMNQYNFFYNVDLNQVAFFNYDDKDMGEKISHYFEKQLNIKFLPELWTPRLSEDKQFLYEYLNTHPDYMANVKKYLETDYEFLSTIKYYEPN